MLIDTHCHLRMMSDGDIANIVADAKSAGVGALVFSAADPGDEEKVLEVVNKFENIFGTLGLHPEHANKNVIPRLDRGILADKIIAIGETGLDYHYVQDNKQQQRDLFSAQLEIAKTAKLPVVVHSRDAEEDTYDILKNYDGAGVMHCFTGTYEFAKKMLDRGFYISASGIITFKNADALREVFKKIPSDRILVETDAPFCTPVPYRGKECRPAHVVETARMIANIREVPFAEMEKILFENTLSIFPKISLGGQDAS